MLKTLIQFIWWNTIKSHASVDVIKTKQVCDNHMHSQQHLYGRGHFKHNVKTTMSHIFISFLVC